MKKIGFLFIACFQIALVWGQKKDFQKKGFVFGMGLGTAYSIHLYPQNTTQGIDMALDLKAGYMLNNKCAILLTSNVSTYQYEGLGRTRKRDFGVLAPAIQYWISEKSWILGGIGLGTDAPVFFDTKPNESPYETKYYNGIGSFISIGHDIYQNGRMAIDVKARISYRNVQLPEGKTNSFSPAILLGISFY